MPSWLPSVLTIVSTVLASAIFLAQYFHSKALADILTTVKGIEDGIISSMNAAPGSAPAASDKP